MGVGWKFYQRPTDFITAVFLRKLLSKKYVHSVRDSYTEKRLRTIGINNVINTSCPTMWNLKDGHCPLIPTRQAPHALITLTAYRHNPQLDKKWLEKVMGAYDKIYFWPQMEEDSQYIKDMGLTKNIEILPPTLRAYDDALSTLHVDFIGTRLHGGIRALQHKRRTIIIEVDNRAVEIARDTGLPTISRDDAEGIGRWIESEAVINLSLPRDNIKKWKDQFKELPI
jgi:polysaccharide pyruvyl transferase WcaK-like protein